MLRSRHVITLLAGIALVAGLVPSGAASAQAGGTVVASGLDNPRGLAVGDDGSIYVAEAGSGGEQILTVGEEQLSWGYTGQVTRIAPDGSTSVVARNFPSSGGLEGSSGLHDVIYANGALWGAMGLVTFGALNLPGESALVRIDVSTGISQTVANLGQIEAQNNPDGFVIESNPYGLTLGPDGMVYVADAGGNDILRVDPGNGQVSLVAVLPGLPLPPGLEAPPGGNPGRGGALELDPVPTGVAFGPDGNLYVSLLSGGPFPPGAARVMRVTMGGQVSVAAEGLTMLTDIKRGPDGNWYAVEFGQFGEQGPVPGSGNIVRITPEGQRQVVAGGLTLPNKIAFDRAGNMYATVNTLLPDGQVVRYSAADLAGGAAGGMPGMPSTGNEANQAAAVLLVAVLLVGVGAAMRRRYHAARL